MCGRYAIATPGDINQRFNLTQPPLHVEPVYNAAPSMHLPVVVENVSGDWEAQLMQWGLIPRWSKPGTKSVAPINARAETLREKPMFRNLIARTRCIVPANGFYEWRQTDGRKQPYYISIPDDPIFSLAGLYDEIDDGNGGITASYTIITTSPNDLMTRLHNRMPVILPRRDEEEWLSRDVTDVDQLERLLVPYDAQIMTAWPVSTAVNNTRHDTPTLIDPIGDPIDEAV